MDKIKIKFSNNTFWTSPKKPKKQHERKLKAKILVSPGTRTTLKRLRKLSGCRSYDEFFQKKFQTGFELTSPDNPYEIEFKKLLREMRKKNKQLQKNPLY